MAAATTYSFSKFLIKLGDGASPEVFTDPCGLTTRGFTRAANMNDTNIPDCADPDAPSWLGREVVSYHGEIAGQRCGGAGKFSDVWEDWWNSSRKPATSRSSSVCRRNLAWIMPAKLSSFVVNANRGEKVSMTVSIVSDGAIVPMVIP